MCYRSSKMLRITKNMNESTRAVVWINEDHSEYLNMSWGKTQMPVKSNSFSSVPKWWGGLARRRVWFLRYWLHWKPYRRHSILVLDRLSLQKMINPLTVIMKYGGLRSICKSQKWLFCNGDRPAKIESGCMLISGDVGSLWDHLRTKITKISKAKFALYLFKKNCTLHW